MAEGNSLWNPDLAPTGPGAAQLGLVSLCGALDRDDRRGARLDARRRADRAGHVGAAGDAHRPHRQRHRPRPDAADRPCRRALRHSLRGAGPRLVRNDRRAAAGADARAGRLRLVRHPDLDRRRGAAHPARHPDRRGPARRAAARARHRRRPARRLPRLLGAAALLRPQGPPHHPPPRNLDGASEDPDLRRPRLVGGRPRRRPRPGLLGALRLRRGRAEGGPVLARFLAGADRDGRLLGDAGAQHPRFHPLRAQPEGPGARPGGRPAADDGR